MPVTIHLSNRMEILLHQLSDVLLTPVNPPLVPECIVVQSLGMRRWISTALANSLGVWGNCRYLFPNQFVNELFSLLIPEKPDSDIFEADILSWRVASILPYMIETPQFSSVKRYLEADNHSFRLYQLSLRIADTFSQYTLFRVDMIEKWEKGGDDSWQAILWRELTRGGGLHRAALKKLFIERVNAGLSGVTGMPERVILFGISYLPAYHLEIISAIGNFKDVQVFVISPCREYWGDIVSKRSKYYEDSFSEGNALLASMGSYGKIFCKMLAEFSETGCQGIEEYVEPQSDSMLSSIQRSILNLKNISDDGKKIFNTDDKSVAVHICHSPMREVEVLYDQLLEMFNSMENLTPRDIIVMTPDIDLYSPYISALFSQGGIDTVKIPFTIADRSIKDRGGIVKDVLNLFSISEGRVTKSEIVAFLDSPSVCAKFGLSAKDVALIDSWLEKTGTVWGLSDKDRADAGFVAYSEGSFDAAIKRMLLGYSMQSDEYSLFEGLSPFNDIEGNDADILGNFAHFLSLISAFSKRVKKAKNLAAWGSLLRDALDTFFERDDENSADFLFFSEVIDDLKRIECLSGFSGDTDLLTFKGWLNEKVSSDRRGHGFLSGKVTFCAMLPMRSIPERVIAIIGMNDGAFPRQNRSNGFDLIQKFPRLGDRSIRDEDRYLFLETLLSARERLYISYTGLGIRDNASIPPSVMVSELLDYIDDNYDAGSGVVSDAVVVRHPLQSFSPLYFNGSSTSLFSYSKENLKASEGLQGAGEGKRVLIPNHLVEPDICTLNLKELISFFDHPCSFFIKNRLGARIEDRAEPHEEREIFDLSHLDSFKIKSEIVKYAINGNNPENLNKIFRARGLLSPGVSGDYQFKKLIADTSSFIEAVNELIGSKAFLNPLDIDIDVAGYRIRGRIDSILPDFMLMYTAGNLSVKNRVRLWINHLFLLAAATPGYPDKSILKMIDGSVMFEKVEEPLEYIKDIIEIYAEGQREPLHLYPRSSFEYASRHELTAAINIWNAHNYPESDDSSYRILFGDQIPLDDRFEAISDRFFSPLIKFMEVI